MKLYADLPARRTRQIVGDLVVLGWVVLWIWLANVVHDATMKLAVPGRQIDEAGSDMADRLRDAGSTVSEIPLVGDGASRPFDGAGSSADRIAEAGRAQVEAVETLAFWLGAHRGADPDPDRAAGLRAAADPLHPARHRRPAVPRLRRRPRPVRAPGDGQPAAARARRGSRPTRPPPGAPRTPTSYAASPPSSCATPDCASLRQRGPRPPPPGDVAIAAPAVTDRPIRTRR